MDKQIFSKISALCRVIFGFFLIVFLMFVMVLDVHASGPLFAKPTLTGAGDCSSWTDACTLQTALAQAVSGDVIWVAAGVHTPGTARENSFAMKSGVQVYGGFAGTETELEARDWFANPTVLSGDIDHNDTKDANGIVTNVSGIVGANAYHVLIGSGADASAVFDGFIINAGQANGTSSYQDQGGGVFLSQGNPSLNNLVISANTANSQGAGLLNDHSSANLTNLAFRGNFVPGNYNQAGGMLNYGGSPTLSNVLFSGNYAYYGGGFASTGGSPILINATLSGNNGPDAGAMYIWSGTTTLTNAILWGNNSTIGGIGATVTYSIVQGGYPGEGNLDVDPLFVEMRSYGEAPTTAGDYRLRYGSPAIDVGSNTPVTSVTDLDGNDRLVDGDGNASTVVDMGAYERQAYTLTINVEGSGNVIISPVQTSYGYHELVKLTANADSHWNFAGWSGDVVGTITPLDLLIQGNTVITATFVEVFLIFIPLIQN